MWADLSSLRADSLQLEAAPLPAGSQLWRAVSWGEQALAGILLMLLLPVLVVSAGLIVLLSRRSPMVAHHRVGQNGRPIWILKLRTMWGSVPDVRFSWIERVSSSPLTERSLKRVGDPRITSRFAAVCRRFSIDELPQLWHVLCGEMSLVGPRPLTRQEMQTHYGPAATSEILTRKPGLSGLWQTHGRSRLTYRQRRRLDLFLIRRWSLKLYLRILLITIPKVLTGRDAW